MDCSNRQNHDGTETLVVIRFLLVGVLNTAFGYGCYALLLVAGLHYAIAALLATIAGVLFNFQSSKRLVFQSRTNHRLFQFILGYCLIYAINVLILAILIEFGLSAYTAGLINLIPSAAMSYFLQRNWVFKNETVN